MTAFPASATVRATARASRLPLQAPACTGASLAALFLAALFLAVLFLAVLPLRPALSHAHELRYFTQGDDVAASATPYGDNEAAGKYVQAGDARIWYEVYGTGKPLFVFHGGGVGSPYELGLLLDSLRDRFRLVVVSTRGHGRSEIGHEPLTYEQKAMDMLAVMDDVMDDAPKVPAAMLGFSDGAYAAFKLAVMRPERVERLVAIGAGTLRAGFFPDTIDIRDLEAVDRAFVDQMRRLSPEPARLQEFLGSYMAFWHEMSVDREIFGNIACPVLFLAGDEDDHAPVKTMLEAHQMTRNSRICIVPKAWHTAFLDNLPVCLAAIEPFLDADVTTLVPSKKVEANN